MRSKKIEITEHNTPTDPGKKVPVRGRLNINESLVLYLYLHKKVRANNEKLSPHLMAAYNDLEHGIKIAAERIISKYDLD